MVFAVFNSSVMTWGGAPWSRPIVNALSAPLDSRTCLDPVSRTNVAFCPDPAREEDWRASDILRIILDDPQCQARQCHLVVVAKPETFDHSVFYYYLVRDFPDSRKRAKVDRADWERGGTAYNARWLTSDYLVYIPQLASGKKILVALSRFLESPAAAFVDAHQEMASFALPGGWTAKLVKRTEPLTLEEARLSIAELGIPEEGKSTMLCQVREQLENGTVAASQEAGEIEPGNQTVQPSPRDVYWSLASSLDGVQAYSDHTELIWWVGGTWAKPYPYDQDVLVSRSVLDVGGLIRPDQVHLHPFSADQNTYLSFDVEDCHDTLQIGYGLADKVAGRSNGVRYTLQASMDGGDSYTVLWEETVKDSVWYSQTVPLEVYWGADLTIQLAVDALGDAGYDWLQTTVRLLPALKE